MGYCRFIADNLNTDSLTSHGDPNHPNCVIFTNGKQMFFWAPWGKKTHLNVAEKMNKNVGYQRCMGHLM